MNPNYVIPFGRKYKGRALKDIPKAELDNYVQWLEHSDIKPGSSMEKQLKELKSAIEETVEVPAAKPALDMSAKQHGRKPNISKNDPYRGTNVQGNVMRHYTTAKGTELPLMNMRGREYLEVKYRLVWFREEHPTWSIETEYIYTDERAAHAKATIRDESGRLIATSHKFENAQGFADFLEKAETGAIGRALALLGYGTQFCADELDEGERIVDAPVGHGHPSEPDVPTPDKATVIAVKLSKRNKDDEKLLRGLGYQYDWVNHCYVKYFKGDEDINQIPFEYEIWERPAGLQK